MMDSHTTVPLCASRKMCSFVMDDPDDALLSGRTLSPRLYSVDHGKFVLWTEPTCVMIGRRTSLMESSRSPTPPAVLTVGSSGGSAEEEEWCEGHGMYFFRTTEWGGKVFSVLTPEGKVLDFPTAVSGDSNPFHCPSPSPSPVSSPSAQMEDVRISTSDAIDTVHVHGKHVLVCSTSGLLGLLMPVDRGASPQAEQVDDDGVAGVFARGSVLPFTATPHTRWIPNPYECSVLGIPHGLASGRSTRVPQPSVLLRFTEEDGIVWFREDCEGTSGGSGELLSLIEYWQEREAEEATGATTDASSSFFSPLTGETEEPLSYRHGGVLFRPAPCEEGNRYLVFTSSPPLRTTTEPTEIWGAGTSSPPRAPSLSIDDEGVLLEVHPLRNTFTARRTPHPLPRLTPCGGSSLRHNVTWGGPSPLAGFGKRRRAASTSLGTIGLELLILLGPFDFYLVLRKERQWNRVVQSVRLCNPSSVPYIWCACHATPPLHPSSGCPDNQASSAQLFFTRGDQSFERYLLTVTTPTSGLEASVEASTATPHRSLNGLEVSVERVESAGLPEGAALACVFVPQKARNDVEGKERGSCREDPMMGGGLLQVLLLAFASPSFPSGVGHPHRVLELWLQDPLHPGWLPFPLVEGKRRETSEEGEGITHVRRVTLICMERKTVRDQEISGSTLPDLHGGYGVLCLTDKGECWLVNRNGRETRLAALGRPAEAVHSMAVLPDAGDGALLPGVLCVLGLEDGAVRVYRNGTCIGEERFAHGNHPVSKIEGLSEGSPLGRHIRFLSLSASGGTVCGHSTPEHGHPGPACLASHPVRGGGSSRQALWGYTVDEAAGLVFLCSPHTVSVWDLLRGELVQRLDFIAWADAAPPLVASLRSPVDEQVRCWDPHALLRARAGTGAMEEDVSRATAPREGLRLHQDQLTHLRGSDEVYFSFVLSVGQLVESLRQTGDATDAFYVALSLLLGSCAGGCSEVVAAPPRLMSSSLHRPRRTASGALREEDPQGRAAGVGGGGRVPQEAPEAEEAEEEGSILRTIDRLGLCVPPRTTEEKLLHAIYMETAFWEYAHPRHLLPPSSAEGVSGAARPGQRTGERPFVSPALHVCRTVKVLHEALVRHVKTMTFIPPECVLLRYYQSFFILMSREGSPSWCYGDGGRLPAALTLLREHFLHLVQEFLTAEMMHRFVEVLYQKLVEVGAAELIPSHESHTPTTSAARPVSSSRKENNDTAPDAAAAASPVEFMGISVPLHVWIQFLAGMAHWWSVTHATPTTGWRVPSGPLPPTLRVCHGLVRALLQLLQENTGTTEVSATAGRSGRSLTDKAGSGGAPAFRTAVPATAAATPEGSGNAAYWTENKGRRAMAFLASFSDTFWLEWEECDVPPAVQPAAVVVVPSDPAAPRSQSHPSHGRQKKGTATTTGSNSGAALHLTEAERKQWLTFLIHGAGIAAAGNHNETPMGAEEQRTTGLLRCLCPEVLSPPQWRSEEEEELGGGLPSPSTARRPPLPADRHSPDAPWLARSCWAALERLASKDTYCFYEKYLLWLYAEHPSWWTGLLQFHRALLTRYRLESLEAPYPLLKVLSVAFGAPPAGASSGAAYAVANAATAHAAESVALARTAAQQLPNVSFHRGLQLLAVGMRDGCVSIVSLTKPTGPSEWTTFVAHQAAVLCIAYEEGGVCTPGSGGSSSSVARRGGASHSATPGVTTIATVSENLRHIKIWRNLHSGGSSAGGFFSDWFGGGSSSKKMELAATIPLPEGSSLPLEGAPNAFPACRLLCRLDWRGSSVLQWSSPWHGTLQFPVPPPL